MRAHGEEQPDEDENLWRIRAHVTMNRKLQRSENKGKWCREVKGSNGPTPTPALPCSNPRCRGQL